MAPFKLNFRMGSSSRSTSQESAEVNENTLSGQSQSRGGKHHPLLASKSLSVTNTACLEDDPEFEINEERHLKTALLLPQSEEESQDEHNAYDNPTIQQTEEQSPSSSEPTPIVGDGPVGGVPATIPLSPPPSYEHVLNENRLLATNTGYNSASPYPGGESTLQNVELHEEMSCQQLAAPTETDNYVDNIFTVWEKSQQNGEFISNKSSKKLYKLAAKQAGITCKMSNECRCMECQSQYFDCEFDDNEQQKTDGGLGAGTPMFISEVMHYPACNIL